MVIKRLRPAHRRGAVVIGVAGLLGALLLGTHRADPASTSPLAGSLASAFSSRPAPEPPVRLVDQAEPAPVPRDALQGSPERRLIAVYRLVGAGQYEPALQAVEALTRAYPTFRLAQLLRADLMSARFAPLPAFGGGQGALGEAGRAELQNLRDEARLRLRALQQRPPEDQLPAEFVSLPPTVPYAIAVDTSAARLYLFQNGPQGMQLVEDVYVSVGKQGVDKTVEGDQRTPLGVYFTTDQLDPRLLQERFGAGALPLNYPNAYDKLKGRTGSGILLHGVTSATYSRPPLDSDGCVAMANEDLVRLAQRLPQRDTPVVITRKIHWVSAEQRQQQASGTQGFSQAFSQWQQARLNADLESFKALYEQSGPADGAAELRVRQRVAKPPTGIADISVLTWHDDEGKLVVTFKELGTGPNGRDRLMRQYWQQSRGHWRIAAEGPVR